MFSLLLHFLIVKNPDCWNHCIGKHPGEGYTSCNPDFKYFYREGDKERGQVEAAKSDEASVKGDRFLKRGRNLFC